MLKQKIHALLFASAKPLTVKGLVNFLKKNDQPATTEEVSAALDQLAAELNQPDSGVHLLQTAGEYQLATAPEAAELVKKMVKEEMTGELTPASLETLTVIAYRGPVAKPELEQIRGVNCSLIIRNLLIRGLIVADEDATGTEERFSVSLDFLRHLGLAAVNDLPDYEKLHAAENFESLLNAKNNN